MQYFTETAGDEFEALKLIKLKYGENARIMEQRNVRTGGFLGFFGREGVEVRGYVSNESAKPLAKKADLMEEKQKILASLKSDQTIQQLVKEVQGLKESINAMPDRPASHEGKAHPSISAIEELLYKNEFSHKLVKEFSDRIRKEFSLEGLDDFQTVQDAVLEWLGERISIYQEDHAPPQGGPRIIILVGPTGVGKTTTIAKLAAYYGLGQKYGKPIRVRMITIDNYRIGAKRQIETYGEIMEIPVSAVETFDDLRKTIDLYQRDVDLILVDTIGKSPHDSMKLAEMRELLAAAGSNAEAHLAVCATTKASDITEILSQFEPFKYRAVIVTKLDETVRAGNVIGALAERQKPVSYITDGQRVPQDLQPASVLQLLLHLEGFRPNRARLEERFPERQKTEWR